MELQTRTIEGLEVSTTKLPAMQGFALMPRVLKIVGPVLASVTTAQGGDISQMDIDTLMPQLSSAMDAIVGDQRLVYDLFTTTSVMVDGKRIELNSQPKINAAFGGNLKALVLSLKFAIEVTFSDFLEGLNTKPEVEATPV